MKFKHINSLDEEQTKRIWRIIGIRHKKAYSQAQLRRDGKWHILESEHNAPINADKQLKRVHTFSSIMDVLEYFHLKGFAPYCPHSDIVREKQPPPKKTREPQKNILHQRNQIRRNVCLNGKLINKRNLKKNEILINDLSFDGAGFTPINNWDFKKGDTVYMTFTLNNSRASEIQRTLRVRHITNKIIGGEFVNKPRLDADLGFFLMFDVK